MPTPTVSSVISLLPFQPVAIALLIMAFLVSGGVILFRYLKRRKNGAEGEPQESDGDSVEFDHREMEKCFRRTLKNITSNVLRKKDLFARPWYLMIGTTSSGKAQALKDSGMVPIFASELELESAEPCKWWVYDDGVILDVKEDLTSGGLGRQTWGRFLKLINKYGSRRSISGIILAISCSEFVRENVRPGISRNDVSAAALNRVLYEVQEKLHINCPIYVVFTQGELMCGFREFGNEVSNKGQILGWSNQDSLKHTFSVDMFSGPLRHISSMLYEYALEIASCRRDSAKKILLLPDAFTCLADQAGPYLARVFKGGTHHEPLILSGLYLSGEGGSDKFQPGTPRTGFLKDLIECKIFPEFVFARPLDKGAPAKKKVLFIRAAMAVLALSWSVALCVDFFSAMEEREHVLESLENIKRKLAHIPRQQQCAAFPKEYIEILYSFLKDVNVSGRPSMPTSWTSNINKTIQERFLSDYQDVMLPLINIALAQRVEANLAGKFELDSLNNADGQSMYAEETPEYKILKSYIQSISDLQSIIILYNRHIISPESINDNSLSALSTLLEYLFGIQVPQDFGKYKGRYMRALHSSRTQPYVPDPKTIEAVESRINVMFNALSRRIFKENEFLRVARGLQELDAAKINSGNLDDVSIRNLSGEITQIQASITDPRLEWIKCESIENCKAFKTLFDPLKESIFIKNYANVQNSFNSEFLNFKADLLVGKFMAKPIFINEEGKIRISAETFALNDVLKKLARQKFIDTAAGARARTMPAHISWNPRTLSDAVGLFEIYETFSQKELGTLPPELRDLVTLLCLNSLQRNVNHLILASVDSVAAKSSNDIMRRQSASIKEAAEMLKALLGYTGKYGCKTAHSTLVSLVKKQAGDQFRYLNETLRAEAFFRIKVHPFAWSGEHPPVYAAYNVHDEKELRSHIEAERLRLQRLCSEYAEPLITILKSNSIPVDKYTAGEKARWIRISAELEKYENKKSDSTMLMLEKFIVDDLVRINSQNYFEFLKDKDLPLRSADYFLSTKNEIRRQIHDICERNAVSNIREQYRAIRKDFDKLLAGRYPFSDNPGYEADPENIREFYRHYDKFIKAYRYIASTRTDIFGSSSKRIFEFTNDMDKVRAFFSPFLEGAERNSGVYPEPVYKLDVLFRTDRNREIGCNQIADWKIYVNERVALYRGESKYLHWTSGEPIRIVFRWAKDSSQYPISAGGCVARDGKMAEFTFTGKWSLIQLVRDHVAQEENLALAKNRKPHTLRFTINTDYINPKMKEYFPEKSQAQAFIRITPFSPRGKDTDILPVPLRFPAQAPDLESARGALGVLRRAKAQ